MQIWVDADACPVAIKQIIFRAANRWQIMTTLIANHALQTPPSPYISSRQVQQGFDVADNEIVRLCQAGDIVITSDIPLADEVISKGAAAISTRGEVYDQQNIKAKLGMRDFMDTMRASGAVTGGPPPLSATDRQQFANQLDKRLAKAKR